MASSAYLRLSIFSPSIYHEVMGLNAMFFECWILSQVFHSPLSLSSRGSSVTLCFSAIRVASSAYLRLLIYLLAILIPVCTSSSPAFLMKYSAYNLNKQVNITVHHLQIKSNKYLLLSKIFLSFSWVKGFPSLTPIVSAHLPKGIYTCCNNVLIPPFLPLNQELLGKGTSYFHLWSGSNCCLLSNQWCFPPFKATLISLFCLRFAITSQLLN